jgi:hypothetical protein
MRLWDGELGVAALCEMKLIYIHDVSRTALVLYVLDTMGDAHL